MNDLKFALRQLLKNPGFTAVAVISLALGIGLNSAVFSIINAIFFQTIRGVPQPQQVMIANGSVSYPAYRHLRTETHTLSGLAAASGTEVTLDWADQTFRRHVPAVSDNYFAALGVRPLLGRFFESATNGIPSAEPEVVLDFQFWKRQLAGDPAVLGQTLRLNGVAFTIVGVAPEAFHGPGPERRACWVPLGTLPRLESRAGDWDDTGKRTYALIGRLCPGCSLAQAQSEIAVLLAQRAEFASPKPIILGAGRENWTGGTSAEKETEFLLVTVVPLVAVGTILWIACSNVANLLLARGVSRRREIAIRLATGASRWRVVRLLLLESVFLSLLGGGLGLVMSSWTVDFAFATFSNFSSLVAPIDGHVLAYTFGISLLSALLFGLVPAWQSTRTDVAAALKSEGAGSISGRQTSKLRSFFLVTQIAGSTALLAITATFVRSVMSNHFGETARQVDHLLVAQLKDGFQAASPRELQRQLREAIGSLPGVRAVTLGNLDQTESARLRGAGMEEGTNTPTVAVQRVDAAFFQVSGMTLLRGRNPDPALATDPIEAAVINEFAARQYWPDQDAIGQRFTLDSTNHFEVTGIVRDQNGLAKVYRPFPETVAPAMALVLTEIPSGQMVGPIRQRLQKLAAERSFPQVATLRDAQLNGLGEITKVTVLVGGLALLLAATGLYCSMAFSSRQRTQEMGIRLALGASRGQLSRLLIGHGFKVAAIGCTAGLVLVFIAFQFMTGLIFGKWSLDLPLLVAVAALFTLVTLVACWLPARRAARTDPMEALRNE